MGGTSVQHALNQIPAGDQDLMTLLSLKEPMKALFTRPMFSGVENCAHRPWVAGSNEGLEGHGHAKPLKIFKELKFSPAEWDSFYKFTIIRNPWDLCVSLYWFREATHRAGVGVAPLPQPKNPIYIERFKRWAFQHYKDKHSDNYFYPDSLQPIADYYIRFETLREDYAYVCNHLQIPVIPLPHLKGQFRKSKLPYWEYYNKELEEMVREQFSREIKVFGYKFGE